MRNAKMRNWTGLDHSPGLRDGIRGHRAKLKVQESRLKPLVNVKTYGISELELVSLQTLRERVKFRPHALLGRLKVGLVRRDVRQTHQAAERAGALAEGSIGEA
jgi:hypothetical protein